ncbi:uncharacterized protein LOC119027449 [Acanthopagrus latus]|uniref:uncharacterized protein LOC119027449 n=1 Tax=Acanthopagrus latus TaxID=8177 RepID=UPI00187C16C4|nr:uncharacterized protein LOC119027449 [Acanthopagrus latus]
MNTMWFALCVTCLFLGRIAPMTVLKASTYVRQDSGFVSANLGDNVTLQCSYTGDAAMFYWYKQTLGQKPLLLSTYYKDDKGGVFQNEFKSDSRFALDTGNGNNHLTISDLRISDSATYYCTTGYKYAFEFVEGFTVSVKGSGLNIPALVHQSASESIQPGGSVNCTAHTGICDEEHSVYWFRHSEGLHPGLMYTHGGRNDQCGSKNNTQTHTCVYNLPTKSLNRSHAGTYCAVASCGHILFGVEKRMPSKRKGDSSVLVYCLTGVLTLSTILVVLLAYAAYTLNKRNGCGRTESQSSASLSPNAGNNQDSDNLHYAALKEFRPNWSPRQTDDIQSECVYSGVRQ